MENVKILFVRHAKAMDRKDFDGKNDLERPLTEEGVRDAIKAFRSFSKAYKKPEVILTSRAVRAVDTAQLLSKAFGDVPVKQIEAFNPGCTPAKFKKVVRQVAQDFVRMAIVGHEPDFSEVVSDMVSDGSLTLEVKKGSCIEVVWDIETDHGTLTLLAPPGFLRSM